jgi:glycosyltransferase involved in cell wall biosynthesis
MKLFGFLQMYNEVEKGNLRRCLNSMSKYCDEIVIYDDASTDDSVKVAREYTDLIIKGKVNQWGKEAEHRQELLKLALAHNPDWIFWLDADEVIEKRGQNGGLRELCEDASFDSYAFHEVNLWRTPAFYRLDQMYNEGWFCRLWQNNGELEIENKPGLHQRLVPKGLKNEGQSDFQVLHYGFANDDNLIDKFNTYRAHGQSGWALWRLVDERSLQIAKSEPHWFDYELPNVSPNDVYKVPLLKRVTDETET